MGRNSFNIESSKADKVTFVNLGGEVSIGEGSVRLRTKIRELLAEGEKNIVLDVSNVEYADSSVVGELISSGTAVNKESGHMILVGAAKAEFLKSDGTKTGRTFANLLDSTRLLSVFDNFDTREQALEHFENNLA